MLDAVIVGGSSAGLSAGLVLGRSRRNVVIFDDGQPCNRFSRASHGFLTRDGISPTELVKIAKEQLFTYPSVEVRADTVTRITPLPKGFTIDTLAGESLTARKVLLATGLKDVLPAIERIEEFWGRSVFHCPYCDGWEVRDQPIVVYGKEQTALHQSMLLSNWTSNLTLCTNNEWEISQEQRHLLTKNGINILELPISSLEGMDGQLTQIVFADKSTLPCKAMFIHPELHHRNTLIEELGCKLTEQKRVQVDVLGRTTITGVYAAGDLANPIRSVAVAVAQGSSAAAGINYDLIVEDFHQEGVSKEEA